MFTQHQQQEQPIGQASRYQQQEPPSGQMYSSPNPYAQLQPPMPMVLPVQDLQQARMTEYERQQAAKREEFKRQVGEKAGKDKGGGSGS
jgi:hypothetical protein